MSVSILDNISYQGKKSNFDRDQFNTLSDMKDFPENSLDEGHVAYCVQTQKHYKYKSTNTVDDQLGRWRLIPDIIILTNTEYEQLVNKDPDTIYMTYDQ